MNCSPPGSSVHGIFQADYLSRVSISYSGDLLNPGIEPASLVSAVLAGRCFTRKSAVKNLPANTGDMGLLSGSGRAPGEGNGNPLQYSCLGNPMDRGAWWPIVHGVAKELNTSKRLNNKSNNFC